MQVFKSKVDSWLLILILACVLASFWSAFLLLSEQGSAGWLWAAFLLLLGAGLPLWLFLTTRYFVEGNRLEVRSGPFFWEVMIPSITSVRNTVNPTSSPALSMRRLEITYGNGKKILVSPERKEEFLAAIDQRPQGHRVPPGFTTVAPYLIVENAERYAEFLSTAFSAIEIGRTEGDNGRIANLQTRIADVTLMLSEASEQYPAMQGAYYLYVADAKASVESALAAGASLEMEVVDMSYGDRQGGVRDPAGNIWWISQRLIDEAYHDNLGGDE